MLRPETVYQFINDLENSYFTEVLITHNSALVREAFRCTLTKAIQVYTEYYGFKWRNVKKITAKDMKLQKKESKQEAKTEKE